MKNLFALLCVLAVIGTASATLVYNGDFEGAGVGGPGEGWGFAPGAGSTAGESLIDGNPDGHVTINNSTNTWGVWYLAVRENLADLGIPAGETVTYSLDIKNLSGVATGGGLKAESWDSALDNGAPEGNPGQIGNSGDVLFTSTGSWATYTYDYTIAAGADQLQFVLLNVSSAAAEYGYDNADISVAGKALRPIPSVGATAPDDTTTAVTWENPAGTSTVAAYLLESDVLLDNEPNMGQFTPGVFEPGTQTLVVDGGLESASVSLTVDKYYYWNVHVNGTAGYTWNFLASGDSFPTVDAGADQYLETTGSPMVLNLGATVTDDGTPTILWEDISNAGDRDPDTTVTINSAGTAATTVTLTNAVSGVVNGWYHFQVTVDDGPTNPDAVDDVYVGVYGTCAEAAAADPADGWVSVGDLDGSCKTDLVDFALFAGSWLDCDSLRVSCP